MRYLRHKTKQLNKVTVRSKEIETFSFPGDAILDSSTNSLSIKACN